MRPFNFDEIWQEWTTERVGDLQVRVSPREPGSPGMFWDIDELQEDHTWVTIEKRIGQGAVSNFLRGNRAALYQGSGNFTGKYHPSVAIKNYYDPHRWR